MTQEKFHEQMHRAYRLARGRVAQRVSPLDPVFADLVAMEFAAIRWSLQLPASAFSKVAA